MSAYNYLFKLSRGHTTFSVARHYVLDLSQLNKSVPMLCLNHFNIQVDGAGAGCGLNQVLHLVSMTETPERLLHDQ